MNLSTRAVIRGFVEKELSQRGASSATPWADQDSLLLSNKTDSLFFVDLIVFLEKKFSLSIAPAKVSKEDLDSVDKMVKFVETHSR